MFHRLALMIVTHPKWVLLGSLLIAIVSATNIPRLGFDFQPQQLFRSSTDAADFRDEFAERFGREDNVVFVLVEADDVFAPAVLEFTRDLTLRLRDIDDLEAADSLPTMQLPRPDDGTLATAPIIASEGPVTAEDAAELRALASGEPLVLGNVVGPSGKLTAVVSWVDPSIQDIPALEGAIQKINDAIASTPAPDGLTTTMAGVPVLRTMIVDELKFQQVTFIPATGLVYLIILLLLFRRPLGVVGPLTVVAITVLLVTSLLVVTGKSINIVNNILPTLIFIICIADSIHMLVRDAEETEAGLPRQDSVAAMVRHTGTACLLTSSTTAVGFGSLIAANTEILQDFGWQAAASVMLGFVITVIVLPALAIKLRPIQRTAAAGVVPEDGARSEQPRLERTLNRLGHHVLRYPKTYIAAGLLAGAIGTMFAVRVHIDTVVLEVFEPGHPAYDSTILIEEELSGVLPVEIALEAPDIDAFKDPALFAKIRQVQQFAAQDDIVLGTTSLVDYHQSARAALIGDPAERDVMPDSREQIEQLHLLIAGAPDDKIGASRFITSDFRHARILLRVQDAGAIQQLRLATTLEAELDRAFANTPITYQLTGDAYVASAALTSFIRDLFMSLLLATVIIFGMMTVVFRSLSVGLISMLPNLIPLVLTMGYMGLVGIDLNTSTVIIFSISLGLAVDDTIHFLARFREELDRHPTDVHAAVIGAYNGAGRAIVITTVLLMIGLVVLTFSSFVPAQYFAKLTAITLIGAIVGDLMLLPPALYLLYQWKLKRAARRAERE